MEWLQRALLWFATASVAYSTFYVGDAGFGSTNDYLKLFTWALGVTQAGAQILSQARRT
jgi:hypothetical protein